MFSKSLKNNNIVVLGSTGMLGQAIVKESLKRNYNVIGIARENADICMDIINDNALQQALISIKPNIIINCVALVSLMECKKNPSYAYLVNARPSFILSSLCDKIGAYYIYISTDHYFTGDKDYKHKENDPMAILNEYALTKYIGEKNALLSNNSLVVRTNIVGFRNNLNHPTFLEWIINEVRGNRQITLFEDYFTSSIYVKQFAQSLFDLIDKRIKGIINLASREVKSKKDFILELIKQLEFPLSFKIGNVNDLLDVKRAESLGLDVANAEQILGYLLPNFKQVIENIVSDFKKDVYIL